MRTKVLLIAAFVIAAMGLAGCGSDSSVGVTPPGSNSATLKLVVDSGTDHTVVDQFARSTPLTAGAPDSLTINSGKFLVRSLQFMDVTDHTVDTDISAADEARDESNPEIPFGGPYILSITGSAVTELGSQTVEIGNYNALSLVLHKGKSTDDLGGDTDMVGHSVRVTGNVWYGNYAKPFVFDIDLRTEIIVRGDFSVPESGSPEYVLEFSVGKWFRFGDRWLDPNDVENLSLVYRNIQRKINGGRDYNGDGQAGD